LYHTGEFSLMEIVDKMSRRPAKILGTAGGSLAVGAVADITVFDPEYRWTVEPTSFIPVARPARLPEKR
jgi:dihydroorotase